MIMRRIHLQALAVPTVENAGTFLPAVHGGALPPGVHQGPVYARKNMREARANLPGKTARRYRAFIKACKGANPHRIVSVTAGDVSRKYTSEIVTE